MAEVEPRAWTTDEMREKVLRHIAGISKYWCTVEHSPPAPGCEPLPEMTTQYRLNGLVHSIFAMLEGRTLDIPAFDIVAAPHESDEPYQRDQGENWWACGADINDGGSLTGQWHKYQPKE